MVVNGGDGGGQTQVWKEVRIQVDNKLCPLSNDEVRGGSYTIDMD